MFSTESEQSALSVLNGLLQPKGENDRIGLLHTLATLPEHPESVPINALVSVDGTPLGDEDTKAPDIWDMGRMIATARVVMPRTMVRLSAGRLSFSEAEQVSFCCLYSLFLSPVRRDFSFVTSQHNIAKSQSNERMCFCLSLSTGFESLE